MGWSPLALLCLGLVLSSSAPAAPGDDAMVAPACIASTGESAALPVVATPEGLVTADGAEVILAGIAVPSGDPQAANEPPKGLLPGLAGTRLRLLPTAPRDRYGRQAGLLLAADGSLLQARLVRDGAAIVRPESVGEACAAALLALEREARDAGAGLWRDSKLVARATDTSSLLGRNGLYALVEGRIVSVGSGSRMLFLDFGWRFRTDFSVLVPETLASRLREAGFPVESLEGRILRVRGIIEESGGPAIRLASPLALELVDVME